MPGHSRAATAAYPFLACQDDGVEVGYFFAYPCTAKSFPKLQGSNVLCAGRETTFEFLETVLKETFELFPSEFIHVGGDEVGKGFWKKCPDCRARMEKEGLGGLGHLQSYFMKRMEKFINASGRRMIGWDEILEGGLAPNATVMSWRGEGGGIKAAKMGHDVVMTPGKPLYFDHGQSKSRGQPKHWPGTETLEEVYLMYTIPLDGDPNKMKWVIADAGTRYEVGDFDGRKWMGSGQKDEKGNPLRFDFGDSYYAAQVFNQGPGGRVVHVGWLRSKFVGYRPFLEGGMPFTQQLSIPAEITLRTTPEGIRMFRNPVREIEKLYTKTDRFENLSAGEANARLAALAPELIDMTIAFAPQRKFTLNIRGLRINYDDAKKEFNFTNSARVKGEKAGKLTLPKARQRPYRDTGLRAIPAQAVKGRTKLRVLVDRASLELFANDGRAAASFVVVPDPGNRGIAIEGNDRLRLDSIVVNELKSCWEGAR